MSELYHYVFHYDHYTKTWNAIPRQHYVNYWTDRDNCPEILKSSQISTLIEMIERGEEFIKSIK